MRVPSSDQAAQKQKNSKFIPIRCRFSEKGQRDPRNPATFWIFASARARGASPRGCRMLGCRWLRGRRGFRGFRVYVPARLSKLVLGFRVGCPSSDPVPSGFGVSRGFTSSPRAQVRNLNNNLTALHVNSPQPPPPPRKKKKNT